MNRDDMKITQTIPGPKGSPLHWVLVDADRTALQFTGEDLDMILKGLQMRRNRQAQKVRRYRRLRDKLAQQYRESKLRDALLITGGCTSADLPGTTGKLRETIHSLTRHIDTLNAQIEMGGAIIEQLEGLKHE